MTAAKVCRRCNSSFEASHGNQRYCSQGCRTAALAASRATPAKRAAGVKANAAWRRRLFTEAAAVSASLPDLDPWDPNDREPVGCSFCGLRTYHWTGCPEEAA
jgi:hypothetical protein